MEQTLLLTDSEQELLRKSLISLVHRLRGKISNDVKNNRHDLIRVSSRKESIKRCELLIEKITLNVPQEVCQ